MSAETEPGLRRALWGAAAAVFAATPIELALAEHWEDPIQGLPFAISALGLAAVGLGWARPTRPGLLGARVVFALAVLAGAFGVWEHLEHNLGFAIEIAPNGTAAEWARDALTGASPLLAPGILALAAALGWAATWRHPALSPGG